MAVPEPRNPSSSCNDSCVSDAVKGRSAREDVFVQPPVLRYHAAQAEHLERGGQCSAIFRIIAGSLNRKRSEAGWPGPLACPICRAARCGGRADTATAGTAEATIGTPAAIAPAIDPVGTSSVAASTITSATARIQILRIVS